MTKLLPAIALVAACNDFYGLERTGIVDGISPDAPPSCDRELVFSRRVRQVVFQPCWGYSTSTAAERALSECTLDGAVVIAEGPVDQPLAKVVVDSRGTERASAPRIAPEGDRAIIRHGNLAFSMHVRDDVGWRWAYDLPMSVDSDDTVGVPSRRPNARMMHARPNQPIVDEYVEEAPDQWRLLHSYDLGSNNLYVPFNLSGDGLHVVFGSTNLGGASIVQHARRNSLAERFAVGTPIPGAAPGIKDGFITDDCGRLYFTGLGSIFFAPQEY